MLFSNAFRKLIRLEAADSIFLFAAALTALLIANIPGCDQVYNSIFSAQIHLSLLGFELEKNVLHLINDGLMAIFFLLVALEIKREFYQGELSSWNQAALPLIAALGGVIVPAIIYSAFAWHDEIALRGWAISSATDIAFALGVLGILGSRIPFTIRVFLMTLAVLDDLASIFIIALFYSTNLSLEMILFALIGVLSLLLLKRFKCARLFPYLFLGLFMWFFILESGVHATLAGVVLGFIIPIKIERSDRESINLSSQLEHILRPWVAYVILPIFAFANTGLDLSGISAADFSSPVTLGIICGLVIGKPLGISLACFCAFTLGIAIRPSKVPFRTFLGVSFLGGIGFTMSLFIGSLAFEHVSQHYLILTRLGVLCGSFISGSIGFILLAAQSSRPLPNPNIS